MIKPNTIFTKDNLYILRGMDAGSVDLIYLDPPFNSKRDYAAPIGSKAAGAHFKDTWTLADTDVAWWGEIAESHPALYKVIDASGAAGGKNDKAYCIYMAVRLLEMKRVLKSTGSIYYHCDPTMSHSIKLMMDSIFGASNFRNEIVWKRFSGGRAPSSPKKYPAVTDSIFFYSAGAFDLEYKALTAEYVARRYYLDDHDGKGPYRLGSRIPDRKYYLANAKGVAVTTLWDDFSNLVQNSPENVGYPTQKPRALLKRIISASSNEGDLVLDPFCGCATACVAAQDLGREWIGIDISAKAYELIQRRFTKELGLLCPKIIHRIDIPIRADQQKRSKNIKHIRFGEQQGKCNGCMFEFQFRNFEVDHIIPLDEGGVDSDENLQLLCGSCNRIKGKRTMAYLKAQLRTMGVINGGVIK